jgi:CCR4-NOT transcription complex subunit 6
MELVQKEVLHYNDLVEKYVHTDHVNSDTSNNSSPTEGNGSAAQLDIIL